MKAKYALFSFYGAKARIAEEYPKPEFDTIIEPFAGAAGYSLMYPEKNVILYEKDPLIAGVLDYLIRVDSKEIMDLPLIEPDKTVDDYQICQEAKWMIGFWLANGKQRPNKKLSKWSTKRNEWPNLTANFWGIRCRERVARTVDVIKHWKVYNQSWENSERHNDKQSTWFIDPPYIKQGHHYTEGSRNIDYNTLTDWCKDRKGQTIVCESLGAEWLDFRPLIEIQGIGKGRKRSTEVIWTQNR